MWSLKPRQKLYGKGANLCIISPPMQQIDWVASLTIAESVKLKCNKCQELNWREGNGNFWQSGWENLLKRFKLARGFDVSTRRSIKKKIESRRGQGFVKNTLHRNFKLSFYGEFKLFQFSPASFRPNWGQNSSRKFINKSNKFLVNGKVNFRRLDDFLARTKNYFIFIFKLNMTEC